MKIKVVYNDIQFVEDERGLYEIELLDFVSIVKSDYVYFYNNYRKQKSKIKILMDKIDNKQELSFNDFDDIYKLILIVNTETEKYSSNGVISDRYIKQADFEAKETLKNLKELYKNVLLNLSYNRELFIENISTFKDDMSMIKNIESMIYLMKRFYYLDDMTRHLSSVYLLNVLSKLYNSSLLNDERMNAHKNVVIAIKYLYKRIDSKRPIELDKIRPLYENDIRMNINLSETLSPDVIMEYNKLINEEKIRKEDRLNSSILDNKNNNAIVMDTKYEDVDVLLSEDDYICLDMYLEVITQLANGNIDMDDFENKTFNYISEIEDTNFKEILKQLIVKIQNNPNWSSSFKKRSNKILRELIRTA